MQAYCSQTERHTSHSNCIICSRKHSVALNVHHGALAATSDDSPSHRHVSFTTCSNRGVLVWQTMGEDGRINVFIVLKGFSE